MTLLELAERCEAATGPDRELDRAIFEWLTLVDGFVPDRAHQSYPQYAYTASLDAAMTLVPEGWEPLIDGVSKDRAAAWIVELYAINDSPPFRHGSANTGALALCAAALRARAALSKQSEER